jgi:hypothetical protein
MKTKINAIIINRNLLTTLKGTIDFLKKDDRLNIIICDQCSDYPPLLDFYKTYDGEIIYSKENIGKFHPFQLKDIRETEYFIVTDPDCDYSSVPNDWLDKMINVLENSPIHKVGFSLSLDNILDNNPLKARIVGWESRFWREKNEFGYVSKIDSTFALYRKNSRKGLDSIRLESPYIISHVPWELDYENLSEEWLYYFENVKINSPHWSNQYKKYLIK